MYKQRQWRRDTGTFRWPGYYTVYVRVSQLQTVDKVQWAACCTAWKLRMGLHFSRVEKKRRYISIVLVLILKFRFSVHKVLLEHRHAHSFIYCLQLLWCDKGRSEYLWQGPSGPQNLKYLQSGLWWKVCQTLVCMNDLPQNYAVHNLWHQTGSPGLRF